MDNSAIQADIYKQLYEIYKNSFYQAHSACKYAYGEHHKDDTSKINKTFISNFGNKSNWSGAGILSAEDAIRVETLENLLKIK